MTTLVDPPGPAPGSRPTRRRRVPRPRTLAVVVVLAAVLGIGAVLVGRSVRPHLYAGTVLQGNEPAPSMATLQLADGSPVDLARWEGRTVVVFFGYRNCPDVCPTTLATLARALERVEDPQGVEVLMVTVDPERDTPTDLETHVEFFHPDFDGAWGEPDAVEDVASLYGVYFVENAPTESGVVTFDHTATLIGIGPDGAVRIIWPPGIDADSLAADLDALG